jgi:hypothetical protein
MFPSGNRIQTTGDAVLDAQALLEACEKRKPKSNMAIAPGSRLMLQPNVASLLDAW